MNIKEMTQKSFRFSIDRNGVEVGRVRLCLIENDLHQEPYGLIEDLYVDRGYRKQGVAKDLMSALFEKAKESDCYKVIANNQDTSDNQQVQDWYQRLGFKKYGIEFRYDL